jgi:hypothetical protein
MPNELSDYKWRFTIWQSGVWHLEGWLVADE